jgi:hypothetical protein
MKKLNISDLQSNLLNDEEIFLQFLKTKFPLFHNSNFFLRDLQFGVKDYYKMKGINLSYSNSEKLARLFSEKMIHKKIFFKITDNSFKINNLNYITKVPGDPFKEIQIGGNLS